LSTTGLPPDAGTSLPDLDAEPPERRTPDALLSRLEAADVKFNRILTDVRNRNPNQ
jgi:hypothetical protein